MRAVSATTALAFAVTPRRMQQGVCAEMWPGGLSGAHAGQVPSVTV